MKVLWAILRYASNLPQNLGGWLVVLAVHALWGRRLFWAGGSLCTIVKDGSWPMNKEKKLGGWLLRKIELDNGAVIYRPWGAVNLTGFAILMTEAGANTKTLAHELQHTRQGVARGLGLLPLLVLFAIFYSWWMALIVWALQDIFLGIIGVRGEAWTNGSPLYFEHSSKHGNINEEHAYSTTTDVPYHPIDDVLDGKVEYELPRGPFTNKL